MRRTAKYLGYGLAALLGVVVVLLGGVLIAANTQAGQDAIARLVPRFTGGEVSISGLTGRFPDALRVGHIELRDPHGTWLTVDQAALDWTPTRLFSREVLVNQLTAQRIALLRQPAPRAPSSSSSSYSFPVQVTLEKLRVDRVELPAALVGKPMVLVVDGTGRLESLQRGQVDLSVQSLAGDGSYTLAGRIDGDALQVKLAAQEPAHGMLAQLATLPDLGPIKLDASLDGPRSAVATQLTLTAGPLQAKADGRIDLVHQQADVSVTASAPAMKPRPDLSWQAVTLNARAHGAFTAPDASGTLRINALAGGGASVRSIVAELSGNAGAVRLHAVLDGLHVLGPQPDAFAAAPLVIDADATLAATDRSVRFTVRHPLLSADGTAHVTGTPGLELTVNLPDLTKLAGDLPPQATAATGNAARIDLAATVHDNQVAVSRLRIDGGSVAMSAQGNVGQSGTDLDWTIGLGDLAAFAPALHGEVTAKGHVSGVPDNLTVTADLTGTVAAPGVPAGQITAQLKAEGLPNAPSGQLTAQGMLLGAPLQLALTASRRDGTMRLAIQNADWKSAHAEGAVQMTPPETLPEGKLSLTMTRLADLEPLLGRPIAGNVTANLDADKDRLHLTAQANGAGMPGSATLQRATLTADVTDPMTRKLLTAKLRLDGIAAGGLGGSAQLDASGPPDALGLRLTANVPSLSGGSLQLTSAASLDAGASTLTVSALQAGWKGQTMRLLAPTRLNFDDGVAIDRLRIGLRQAVLDVSGHVGTTMALTAQLRGLPADLAAIVAPDFAADGTVQADAQLAGTPAQPTGTVRVSASGLRMRSGPGRALPAATVTANATLNRNAAQVDVRLNAGSTQLTVTGNAPLAATGALDLRAAGKVDLTLLDPLLAAAGRRVRGQVTLTSAITGTVAAPNITGSVQLANGDVNDYAQGIHISAISARLIADGNTLQVSEFSGRAGPGTINVTGSVGLRPPMPINLHITANNAQPLSSDLLTAMLDADLNIGGEVSSGLTVGGTVHVRRAEIRVPERLPVGVATLPVAVPGAATAPPSAPGPTITLNLAIEAPEQIFIRGRGLDAELGGHLVLTGTTTNLIPAGGLHLRRGQISLVGHTLQFTSGTIGFNGGSLTDPALNLVSTTTSGTDTDTLTIGGTASQPKITLSSSAGLPQDEILAHLLFGTSASQLSPFQLAEIAASLASLSGATSGFGNPLDSVRQSLGLDVLSVGGGSNGSPSLQAGRYVAPGVYVGAQQSATGGGSQATVQIDLTKGLKLESSVGNGTTSALGSASNANGASVGLKYQFEY